MVTDVAAEGKAMGKVDDKVVFVTQAVPGDIVDVQVNKKRRSYYEGFPVKFHHYSDLRVEPFCAHFGVCGGCKWQSLPYAEQLKFKEREVVNNLQRIGKVELPEVQSIMGSPAERFYRNKLEFTFSNKRWLSLEEMEREEEVENKNGLGFHIPGMFDKVVDIAQCHLMAEPSNAIRNALREYALANALPFYDLRAKAGFLRTLMIRNTSLGEVMVVLSLFQEDESARKALFDHLIGLFPDVTSWMYVINPKANDTIGDLDIQLYAGRDHIFEEME